MRTASAVTLIFLLVTLVGKTKGQNDTQSTETVTMATFQRDGIASPDTFLKFRNTLPTLTKATVCFRLFLEQARDEILVLSYAHPEHDNELYVGFKYESRHTMLLMMTCCGHKWERDTPLNLTLRQWSSFCVALDLSGRTHVVVQDGEIRAGVEGDTTQGLTVRPGGVVVVGQEQDRPGEGFVARQSLRGSLVDLRLFGEVLATEDMQAYTRCLSWEAPETPLLHFDNVFDDFEVSRVDVELVVAADVNRFCRPREAYEVLFPEPREFDDAQRLCRSLGGAVSLPKNNAANAALYGLALRHLEACDAVWLGLKGNATGRFWYDASTRSRIAFANFEYRAGRHIEEPHVCASYKRGQDAAVSGEWVTRNCAQEFCAACRFETPAFVRVRGLCARSLFDREYFLLEAADNATFRGAFFSELRRFPPRDNASASDFGSWQLSRLDDPNVRATLTMRHSTHYPIGLNNWTVANDVCGDEEEVTLRMTACGEDEFSCGDGSCVPLRLRCNRESNCGDRSDEVDCHLLAFPSRYDDTTPPPRPHPSSPVSVTVFVHLLSIRAFDLTGFNFVSEVEVRFAWNDSRLQLRHLKDDPLLNVIHLSDRSPWMPDVEFVGDALTSSDVDERHSFLMAERLTSPLPPDDVNLEEDEIFEGGSNPLVSVRKLTVTTSCQFDLITFPFDTQTCKLELQLRGLTKDYIALEPQGRGVMYSGKRKLLQYYLKEEFMKAKDVGNYSGQVIEMKFRNLSTFYVTSTYIPTFIIVIIGYIVFYFPVDDFNERIMVALTALLVEAAFFTQMSASIPQTAYLKLVDIWFVYCITSLFLVVVTVAFINWCKKCAPAFLLWVRKHEVSSSGRLQSRRNALASRLNILCRIICPILTGLFFVVYLTMAALIEIPELPIEIPSYQSFLS